MKLLYHLNEDKIAKLPVLLSSEVEDLIEDIDYSNRFNENELVQFYCDLEGVIMWISNTSIAWDNSNSFRHFNNGTTYLERFGFKITYIIKVNETSHQSFVYILTLNFNFDDYGLQIPSYITENNNTKRQNTMKQRIRLTEGDLHRIVRKCINEALDEMEWPTYYHAAKKMYNSDKPNSYDRAQSLMDKAVKEFNKKHSFDAVGDEHDGFSDQKPYRDIKTYHANNWGKEYGGAEIGTQAFEGNPDGTIPYSYGQKIGKAHYMPNRGDDRDITGPSHYHHGSFSDELVAAANKGNKELEDVYNGKIKYKNGHWSY